ncbi:uncharacterized protein LOC127863122 [Dreissena polymorpha]|uniref:C1q domain-containing protein n=1 Tax=Dreissena polymorpha TaxID=45954 RepID=A0A9D4BH43_DREPO|nr:uncharacterized protein LOC127863122 [Dreissena polymorpha]KAH3693318.1 hypothetical protein DPMN_192722 [Dreissena polymorpha]
MWIFLALAVMFGTSFSLEPFCPVCSECEHEEKVLERALSNVLAFKDTLDNITATRSMVEENLKMVHDERVQLRNAMAALEVKKREFETKMQTLVDQTRFELNAMKVKNIVPVVLFHARLNVGDISYNENDRIPYRDVVVNEGGGYDQYTGIFTASVGGVYMFTVQSCNAKNKWASFEIVHGGRPLQRSNIWDKENRICSSMQSFAKVAIGEKIWVRSTWDNIVVYSDTKYFWNTFSGLLIHI